MRNPPFFVALWVLLVVACGGGDPPPTDAGSDARAPSEDSGPDMRTRTTAAGATGVTCPPGGTTLTYDSFAAPFFTAHCTRCHSSANTGAARNGAPIGFDFDTAAGVAMRSVRIDAVAAAGADRINIFMPLSGSMPADAERDDLAEWIACGMP